MSSTLSWRPCMAISLNFEAFYAHQPVVEVRTDLLVMSVDGKGVVIRHQDLREATRKADERSKRQRKPRLSRGEKRGRKRMARVASEYEVDAYPRTAEQIMGLKEAETMQTKVQNKRVWASLRQSPDEVIEAMFAEAERRDPRHERTWLVLVDGQESKLKKVAAAIARHPCEKAKSVTSPPACAAPPLARIYPKKHGKRSTSAPDYLLKNKARFDYATALANGWPIATGIIEGACR